MFVRDGQSIRIEGEETIEVIANTRPYSRLYKLLSSVKKVLISSEASGCLNSDGSIFVEFLADFDDYLASLKRIAGLQVDVLCQGHRLVFVGRDEGLQLLCQIYS